MSESKRSEVTSNHIPACARGGGGHKSALPVTWLQPGERSVVARRGRTLHHRGGSGQLKARERLGRETLVASQQPAAARSTASLPGDQRALALAPVTANA